MTKEKKFLNALKDIFVGALVESESGYINLMRVVGVFGSYVRGERRRRSDLDLLADILRPTSLLELVGAELYLSEILEVKVDLVPKRAVREELRETILREAVAI